MTRFDGRTRALAACLSALAGYVDAIGFLSLGGFFVSFMSGNSTRLGVGVAQGSTSALIAAALIAIFVTGVIIGSLVGHFGKSARRAYVLLLVAFLLSVAASLGTVGAERGAAVAMALAMGAENAVFERDGEVQIGLTYMTGTLVKLGQRISSALLGGDPFGWMPFLFLWLGLVSGATAGAFAYPRMGLPALWGAVPIAALCAIAAARLGPERPETVTG